MSQLNMQQLKNKIRYGTEPDNAGLVSFWLELDGPPAGSLSHIRQHYEEQFRLLLDVVMDELVEKHWRLLCLDHIHSPLLSLKRVSRCPCSQAKINKLFNELSISCKYTEHSLY